MKDEGKAKCARPTRSRSPSAFIPQPSTRLPWPKSLAEQARTVRAALTTHGTAADAATLAKAFKGAKPDRVEEILETLASLGQARAVNEGRYVAV